MFTSVWKYFKKEIINSDIQIRQVYLWVFDRKNNLLIVSKDGENWQIPGGKPNLNETLKDTAIREVFEETGLDVVGYKDEIKVFGYYLVSELDNISKEAKDIFIQVRLELTIDSFPVSLSPNEPPDSEAIKYVKEVPFSELLNYIPWMAEKNEYQYIKKTRTL